MKEDEEEKYGVIGAQVYPGLGWLILGVIIGAIVLFAMAS